MSCDWADRDSVLERYLRGETDAAEQEAFEQHWFGCASCTEDLRLHGLLKHELEAGTSVTPMKAAQEPKRWFWAAAAAAASIAVVGLGLWAFQPSSSSQIVQTPPALSADLVRIDPPPYTPSNLRGAGDDAVSLFRQAMSRYSAGDYAAAVEGLSKAAGLSPSAPHIRFFLGISLLLDGRTDAAIATLRETVSLGESVYLEEARFYLAKAHLRNGDPSAARAELEAVLLMDGELRAEAERLLLRLESP